MEDLLDIKIFSTMNGILKDEVRSCNEVIRETDPKDMIEDKIEMQESFIRDIEKSGKEELIERETSRKSSQRS